MFGDEDFERSLSARLRGATDGIEAQPGLATAVRRKQVRRDWALRGAMVVPMAAAVATVAVSATGGVGAPTNSATGPDVTATVEMYNVALVRQKTAAALANADKYVIQYKNRSGDKGYAHWSDPKTRSTRYDVIGPNGQVRQSNLSRRAGDTMHYLGVDHESRTWHQHSESLKDFPGKDLPSTENPEALRKAVAEGVLDLIGPERVDGRDTLHLRLEPGPMLPGTMDVWVDKGSYLPVRIALTKTAEGARPYVEDYVWLPRTAENLAHVELKPPAGYKKA